MEKLNIAEILKDCPKDMELDCTMYDNLYFDSVNADYYGTINCYTLIDGIKTSINFTKYGTFNNHTGAKCVIFPKGKTTWEGFIPPCKFKDGDVLAEDSCIFIIQKIGDNYTAAKTHCTLYNDGDFDDGSILYFDIDSTKLATEEEKAKLFQAIKDNGYKWNTETKTLEKLIEPKFKVGDRIKWFKNGNIYEIIKIVSNCYIANYLGSDITILWNRQDEYELVPNKFDISTLKPFESRVLVRDYYHQCWKVSFFGYFDKFMGKFDTVRGVYIQCIPYEGNEHLLGTTDDCIDYYKNW